ncbi:hypothetical protein ID866_5154 [Astraeus odoratus]|nr:hypothetical protein ID866_5154 [Astraeus odoratus]
MHSLTLASLIVLAGLVAGITLPAVTDPDVINATCQAIVAAISSESAVYYEGDQYDKDIYHWASSSTQEAGCAVEPGTPEDVGTVLQIIAENNCAFAVKGGGHTSNPGFSSTPGVQIAMYRFSEVIYNSTTQTVTVGAGLIWDDVYAALEPHGVNVVGGRVTGVGVAGFTLGGGYSWLTNQYGLTIDNVEAYELVLPNGTIASVTQSSYSDLFFALKGGFNNFGIVTRFTLKAFPQGEGGAIVFLGSADEVTTATANFSANSTDPKASIITTYNYLFGLPAISAILFYDGPSPPAGIFDEFLAIPYLSKDITGLRAVFNTVSVTGYPMELLQAISDEAAHWAESLLLSSGVFISYDVEPFLSSIFTHNTSSSAYPGSRELAVYPLNLYFGWWTSAADEKMQNAIRTTASTLYNKAIQLGQNISGAPLYNNYAIFDTPLESMYGENLQALQQIKNIVDPTNVMGLAGGFKF